MLGRFVGPEVFQMQTPRPSPSPTLPPPPPVPLNSTIGFYTGVRVSSTPDVHLSPLFADQHCGEGTQLILYMQGGSVLSRTFTSKDTHTPRGELLVVYGSARQSYRDAQIAHETAAVSSMTCSRVGAWP